MAKRENILPFAPVGKLIQEASGKRVSKDARVTATQILEEIVAKIIHKANLLAENSGRKTIKAKDINLAFNQIKGDL
ncbi:MAG: NFYB/HAP3 family transcription factor subunit [Nanoarchaeota archaeon]|nr:NFYB/HAP3 family transcription factor subunit [Nanoarchaeota archaeon]